jgi:hypothetical protein
MSDDLGCTPRTWQETLERCVQSLQAGCDSRWHANRQTWKNCSAVSIVPAGCEPGHCIALRHGSPDFAELKQPQRKAPGSGAVAAKPESLGRLL